MPVSICATLLKSDQTQSISPVLSVPGKIPLLNQEKKKKKPERRPESLLVPYQNQRPVPGNTMRDFDFNNSNYVHGLIQCYHYMSTQQLEVVWITSVMRFQHLSPSLVISLSQPHVKGLQVGQ